MSYNFDRVSSQYDQTRGLPAGVPEQICRWVLARLPADPQVVEIGVGTGRIAVPFIQLGIRYTGLDISEQMLARAREKLGGNLHRSRLELADVTEGLPLPDQSQEAVIAVHILHLIDWARALHQVRRVLKPGGVLVWGFQWQDENSPAIAIRRHFFAVAAESDPKKRPDFGVPGARALLTDWGAQVTRHVVAVWTEQVTCRRILDGLRSRTYSSTWDLSEAALQAGLRGAEAWAREKYGDLDAPVDSEERFMVDWFVLPGGG